MTWCFFCFFVCFLFFVFCLSVPQGDWEVVRVVFGAHHQPCREHHRPWWLALWRERDLSRTARRLSDQKKKENKSEPQNEWSLCFLFKQTEHQCSHADAKWWHRSKSKPFAAKLLMQINIEDWMFTWLRQKAVNRRWSAFKPHLSYNAQYNGSYVVRETWGRAVKAIRSSDHEEGWRVIWTDGDGFLISVCSQVSTTLWRRQNCSSQWQCMNAENFVLKP